MPRDNRRLAAQLKPLLLRYRFAPVKIQYPSGAFEHMDLEDICRFIEPFMRSPVSMALLSSLVRSAPILDKADYRETLDAAIRKEISTTQLDVAPTLQYPFFHSREACLEAKMHDDYPFRPLTALTIRRKFVSLRVRYTSTRLLLAPQCSFKTVGFHTRQRYLEAKESHLPGWKRYQRSVTQVDLERHYFEEGTMIDGPCEVRSAWKFNDVKPRIYYAIGGSAYFAARYVHRIFDDIAKLFATTNPSHRYSFERFGLIDFSEGDRFMIYDYSSFTSRLADLKEFVKELANFFRGARVCLLDGYHGYLEKDLGDILDFYNVVCNLDGEFAVHRVLGMRATDQHIILHHKVAGMLGVFGNIVGSTSLHGICSISIVGGELFANTIGDDGGVKFNLRDITLAECIAALQVIGDLADDKYFLFDEDGESVIEESGWHYTKRPINVSRNVITQGWMPDFPVLGRVFEVDDGCHTIQHESWTTRRRVFIKQTCRLFDALHKHASSLSDADVDETLQVLRSCYKRFRLNPNGSLPSRQQSRHILRSIKFTADEVLCVPRLVPESITIGWFRVLKDDADEWPVTILLPVHLVAPEDPLPDELDADVQFIRRSDKTLSYLTKMGVLSKECMREERLLTPEVWLDLEFVMSYSYRPVYVYTAHEFWAHWSTYLSDFTRH